jgi:hypothetical protein
VVKILIRANLAPAEAEAYKGEIISLVSFNHPSILYLKGDSSKQSYILVTDYLVNGSLYDFFNNKSTDLSPTERSVMLLTSSKEWRTFTVER